VDRLLTLIEQVEGAAGELSAGELLEAIGKTARLDAVLRTRYAALVAPLPAPALTPEAARYLTAAAAADYLGVSKSTVGRLSKAGTLPCSRPSPGTVRFDRQDLDAFAASVKGGVGG